MRNLIFKAKKSSLNAVLYICMYACITLSAKAQVLPTLPEYILPSAISSPTAPPPLALPYYNSSYSYFRVPMIIGSTEESQDLYVYCWTGGNYFNSGIAWIRRDPNTDSVLDEGYFNLPTLQSHHEVGIVQLGTKTFVVLTFNNLADLSAPYIQLYEWTAAGVSPFPTYSQNIRAYYGTPLFYGSSERVTMDCINLNKVIVAWNEKPAYDYSDPDLLPLNYGGIYLRAIEFTSTGIIMGNTNRIDNTDSMCMAPDVALGSGGDSVHVAYIRKNPTLPNGNIEVQSDNFNNVLMTTLPAPISTFVTAFAGPAVTNIISPEYNNHIRIDAPDHLTTLPLWSLVYLKDNTSLNSITVDPSTLNKNIYYNIISTSINSFCAPVITYSSSTDQYIALGWYNEVYDQYQSTRLNMNGSSIIPPSATTTYYIVNNVATQGYCIFGGKLSFSTSQQSNIHKYLFMTYPINDYAIMASDMRSKLLKWGSTYAYRVQSEVENHVHISPNPLTIESRIYLNEENMTPISIHIIDALGRNIGHFESMSLDELNSAFSNFIHDLNKGTYHIGIQVNDNYYILKAIK